METPHLYCRNEKVWNPVWTFILFISKMVLKTSHKRETQIILKVSCLSFLLHPPFFLLIQRNNAKCANYRFINNLSRHSIMQLLVINVNEKIGDLQLCPWIVALSYVVKGPLSERKKFVVPLQWPLHPVPIPITHRT